MKVNKDLTNIIRNIRHLLKNGATNKPLCVVFIAKLNKLAFYHKYLYTGINDIVCTIYPNGTISRR